MKRTLYDVLLTSNRRDPRTRRFFRWRWVGSRHRPTRAIVRKLERAIGPRAKITWKVLRSYRE